MHINIFETINLCIVLGLFAFIKYRTDLETLLISLFIYGSLHFSFVVLALTSNDASNHLIKMHQEGGGLLVQFSALLFLVSVFYFLSKHAYHSFSMLSNSPYGDTKRKIVFQLLLVMVALFLSCLFNIRPSHSLQLKNILSIEAMMFLVLLGFTGCDNFNVKRLYKLLPLIILIVFVADSIAFYEIFSHKAWAVFMDSSGSLVYRASSLLFNPNLLAFWAAFIYLSAAYCMNAYKYKYKAMLLLMILASVAIYLSGARSFFYLLLVVLFFPLFLQRKSFYWLPLVVLPFTMLFLYFSVKFLIKYAIENDNGFDEFILLGERFFFAVQYLVSYIKMDSNLPIEIKTSIEGRYNGDGCDSGWMVLYQDAGLGGAISIIYLCFIFFWLAWRSYIATHSIASVYALMILCFCILTGLVMRIQIFPVWLFIGVFLIPCLIYWSKVISTKLIESQCVH